jgi:hypothetical protein
VKRGSSAITRSPDHPITRSPDHPITRSPDHSTLDHSIIRSPDQAIADHTIADSIADHPSPIADDRYSLLKVTTGSTRPARRAGT